MTFDWQCLISAFLGACLGAAMSYAAVLRHFARQKRSPAEKPERKTIDPSIILGVVFLLGALIAVYLLMSGIKR